MHRRRKLIALGLAGGLMLAAGGFYAVASTSDASMSPSEAAQRLVASPGSRFMTAPARAALQIFATQNTNLGAPSPIQGSLDAAPTGRVSSIATVRTSPPNVRVNDPSTDTQMIDQTTQSETSIAVSGQHVAVGYNDSQQSLIALTAATNLTGYSFSNDGGGTWHDGGDLPNPTGRNNFGDPWLTTDANGTMYYSNLEFDAVQGLLVGVARSADGGHTWTQPVIASRNLGRQGFQIDDKPAITAGETPTGQPVLYDAWDDFTCGVKTCNNGLPVARSLDGGRTWHTSYAASSSQDTGCTFAEYIGAQPLINPATGTLFVAAERIGVFDPHCNGAPFTFSEVLFTSRDGGQTFTSSRIADVTPAFPDGLMKLGTGQYMRTIEFPSLAIHGGTLAAVWNDGRLTGHSHILLATRPLSGGTWNLRFVTQGTDDEVQPGITADANGWHILYYERTGSSLSVNEASATDISVWTVREISSRSFPGVITAPNFDPIIAWGYMGDYLANVNVGGTSYFAWGDNRDGVTNALWPDGRHDPDVFFASG